MNKASAPIELIFSGELDDWEIGQAGRRGSAPLEPSHTPSGSLALSRLGHYIEHSAHTHGASWGLQVLISCEKAAPSSSSCITPTVGVCMAPQSCTIGVLG